jgi:hypothetical protein
VFFGFQHNAFADEKDKDDKKNQSGSTISKIDSTTLKKIGDITVGDTLVFDDFDEDEEDEDQGESGSIAFVVDHGADGTIKNEVVVLKTHCTVTLTRDHILALPSTIAVATQTTEMDLVNTDNDPVADYTPLEANVYPNPANAGMSPVHVSHNFDGQAQLTVYSMGGRLVRQITTTQKITDIEGLTQGMYIVHISANDQVITKKLLVQ